VKVGVIRRGKSEPESLDLVREKLGPTRIVSEKVDPDLLALRLVSLEPGRAEEVRARLVDAEKQGVKKIVLDLRNCGRGQVSEALAIARLFIGSGNLTTLKGQTVSAQTFAADPSKVVWKGPLSILIDGTTSGAAEVLASAIQANHRGELVGERTFGLASEQKLITIDDGSALILTVANYYNSDGKAILEAGVTPGEVVRQEAANVDDGGDDDDSAGAQSTPTPAEPRPLSPEDAVFKKAIELLKTPAKKAA